MIHAQGETETEHEVTVSNPADAVPQEQTLYDFVVTLLGDATARAAFAEDPAQALGRAGLGDITAEDVQDVIPLVMDYNELPGMDAVGAPEVGAVNGLDGAIAQLRGVAEAAGDRADLAGTTGLDSTVGTIAGGGAATLDGASGVLRYDTEAATGEVAGQLSEDGLNIGSYTDSLVGQAAGTGGVGPESAGGMVGVESVVGDAAAMLDVTRDSGYGTVGFESDQVRTGVFGDVSDDSAMGGAGVRTDVVTGEGAARLTDDGYAAGGSLETPFGTYGIEVSDEFGVSIPEVETTGDLADTLDTDTITRGSEAAASTVATYVTSGGAALHGAARSAAEELPVDLPVEVPAGAVPAGVPAELPADLPVDLAGGPAVDEEVLSESRDLDLEIDKPIQVADLDTNLPNVADTVYGVAGELHEVRDDLSTLPNQLGFEVPTDSPEMPDLPVANPMPTSADDAAEQVSGGVARVADTVSDSPLGGVAEKGEDLLSGASGIGDLDLGH